MNGTRGISRRWRHADAAETAVITDPAAEVEAEMDRIAALGTAARLAELERIHADEIATHRQLASDYAALIEALHARSPQEWHIGEPATAGLAYLRHLEDEADRCGIDRRPPWSREMGAGDERLCLEVAAELGAEHLIGLPAPEATKDPVPEAARPPAGEEAGPAAEHASPVASGTVSTEDEPAGEQDCAEGGDAA
jgi:hypothetical protein